MTTNSCCSLDPAALARRAQDWRSLMGALQGAEPTAGGAVLRYRLEPGVAEQLLRLVEAEAECCPSLSFTAEVTLSIEAPDPAVRDWVIESFVVAAPSLSREDVDEAVRSHYAEAARRIRAGGTGTGCEEQTAGIGAGVYRCGELDGLPEEVGIGSIGCANPVAVAELAAGDTVLDLGSGGGLDVLLSARRVGPNGKAYGLDMTDEMLELARANQHQSGVDNVEFLNGRIESIPLPDASVDVVISNCVLGLSTDKSAVFHEAHRVLRPGGRLAVADVVADAEAMPGAGDVADWVACLSGALTREQYRSGLEAAGFTAISIDDSHPVARDFTSVIVRAAKPPS